MDSEKNEISLLNSSTEIILPQGEIMKVSELSNAEIKNILESDGSEISDSLLEASRPTSFCALHFLLFFLIGVIIYIVYPDHQSLLNTEMQWQILTPKTKSDNKFIGEVNKKYEEIADIENEFLVEIAKLKSLSRYLRLKQIEVLINKNRPKEAYKILKQEFFSKDLYRLPDVMFFSMCVVDYLDKHEIEELAKNVDDFSAKNKIMSRQKPVGVMAWDYAEIKLRMKYWSYMYPKDKTTQNRNYIDSAFKITWKYQREEKFKKLQDEIIDLIDKKWTNWNTISITLPDERGKLRISEYENFKDLENAYNTIKMRGN